MMKRTKICHGKLPIERRDGMLKKRIRTSRENDIINIKQEVGSVSRRLINKERRIGFGGNKAYGLNKSSKALKPCTRSLFKAIKRFVEETNKIWRGGILKTRGLLTINSFIESAMKKSIFNIKLMNRPRRGNSKTKNNTNSAWFNNRRKSLIKVNTMLLGETTTHPTSFVTSESAIGMKFMTKNPFARNNVNTRRFGNKSPCIILLKSFKFIAHSRKPERVKKSSLITGWNRRDGWGGGKIETFGGEKKSSFSTGAHDMIIGERWYKNGIGWQWVFG